MGASKCKDACEGHDATEKLWNKALEEERRFEAKLVVLQEKGK